MTERAEKVELFVVEHDRLDSGVVCAEVFAWNCDFHLDLFH